MRWTYSLLAVLRLIVVAMADSSPITAEKTRAEQTATITLLPEHGIHKRWAGPTPTGSELLVHPTDSPDIPKDGFVVRFGPELAKTLHTVLDVYCDSHTDAKCMDKLVDALSRHGQTKRKKRQVGIGAAVLGPFIAALLIYRRPHKHEDGPSDRVNMPSAAVAEASSHPGADDIVFKSAADDKDPITYDGRPTKTASSHVSVKTHHSNKGHLHKGDVVVAIPKDAAHFIKHILKNSKSCRAEIKAETGDPRINPRDPPTAPDAGHIVNDELREILRQGGGALPVNELQLAPNQEVVHVPLNRLPDIHDADQRVDEMVHWADAQNIVVFIDLDLVVRRFILSVLFLIVYNYCIEQINNMHRIIVEQEPGHTGQSCPDDAPTGKWAPICYSCDGGKHGVCQSGQWEGCPCLWTSVPYVYSDRKHHWNLRQKMIDEILYPNEQKPGTHCGDGWVDVDWISFKTAYQFYCSLDLNKPEFEVIRGGYSYKFYDKYFYNKCPKPGWGDLKFHNRCKADFAQFADDTECEYTSHLMAKKGLFRDECSATTFRIEEAPQHHHHHHHHHHPRSEGPMNCHKEEGCYNEVNDYENVESAVNTWCTQLRAGTKKERTIKPGDPQMNFGLRDYMGVNFFARWMDGCTDEDSHDISAGDCESIYMAPFANCDNGGRGGWHREGCVEMGMEPVCD